MKYTATVERGQIHETQKAQGMQCVRYQPLSPTFNVDSNDASVSPPFPVHSMLHGRRYLGHVEVTLGSWTSAYHANIGTGAVT